MIAYLIILILIIVGISLYDSHSSNNKGGSLYTLICIFMIITMGFAGNMGTDLTSYREDYPFLPNLHELDFSSSSLGSRIQPLWLFLNAFTKTFSNDFFLFLLLHSIVVNIAIFYFIKKVTIYKFTCILFYFLSFRYFYFNLEILRESLAVSIFLISILFFKKHKLLIYYLLCVVAFCFHMSGIFTFLVPLILAGIDKTRRTFLFFPLLILSIMTLVSLGQVFEYFSSFVVIANIQHQYEHYTSLEGNQKSQILMMLIKIIPIVIFIYIQKKYKYNDNLFINITYIYLILTVASPFVEGLYRFENYFIIPYYCMISNLCFMKTHKKNEKKLLLTIAFSIMIVLHVYGYTRVNYMKGDGSLRYEMYLPYRT